LKLRQKEHALGKATESLEREHQAIQKAVAVMARIVDQLELKHSVEADLLLDLIRFMRVFGDQCHHGKEESYLFPLLEQRGVPATGCPLSALKGEHVKGRQLMDEFASATATYIADKESGRIGLIQALQSLVTLYPAHIWKEDFLLFPMAMKVLSGEDDKLLLQQFTEVESGLGSNVYDTYEASAEALMQRVGECPQCSPPHHVID
jgi:hemerythrin-like domain-containing protein